MFDLERESPCERNPAFVPQSLKILWVKESLSKIGSNHIFAAEPCILERRLVSVKRRPGRVQHDNRLRYRVCELSKFALVLP